MARYSRSCVERLTEKSESTKNKKPREESETESHHRDDFTAINVPVSPFPFMQNRIPFFPSQFAMR